MLKRLGFKTLALAAGLAVAAPIASMARDRDDYYRGRDFDRHEAHERHERWEHRDRDWRYRDNGRFGFGFGYYSTPVAPAPAPSGYYDQYGNWIPTNNYYGPNYSPAPAPYYGPYGR